MKKSISFFVLMIGTCTGFAQLNVNPEVGVNLSIADSKIGNIQTDAKYRLGYKAGAGVGITIYRGFYIQPGIYYTVKGATLHETTSGIMSENRISLNYLEIPITLAYRYDFGAAGSVFLFAGPYWGIGINGQSKNSINGVFVENDIKYGDAVTDDFIKADFGLNFGFGYISQLSMYLKLEYALGISNVSNANNKTWENRVFGASLGYVFELNKKQ